MTKGEEFVVKELRFWLNYKGRIEHGHRFYIKALQQVYKKSRLKGFTKLEWAELCGRSIDMK